MLLYDIRAAVRAGWDGMVCVCVCVGGGRGDKEPPHPLMLALCKLAFRLGSPVFSKITLNQIHNVHNIKK